MPNIGETLIKLCYVMLEFIFGTLMLYESSFYFLKYLTVIYKNICRWVGGGYRVIWSLASATRTPAANPRPESPGPIGSNLGL